MAPDTSLNSTLPMPIDTLTSPRESPAAGRSASDAPRPGLGTLLRVLLERLDGGVDGLYEELGTEFRPRYYPVARLLLAERRATLTRIAAAAGVTHSAASQTVAEMARRGLVDLRPGATDARERLVSLTPKGRRVCAGLAPLWAAVERAGAELDAELAVRLGATLSAVLAGAADALAARPFAARVRQALHAEPAPPSDPDPSSTQPDTADANPSAP